MKRAGAAVSVFDGLSVAFHVPFQRPYGFVTRGRGQNEFNIKKTTPTRRENQRSEVPPRRGKGVLAVFEWLV